MRPRGWRKPKLPCTALVPWGVSRQSYAKRVLWLKRRDGLVPMPSASPGRRKRMHCARGHAYRPGSYRVYSNAKYTWRGCKLCAAITTGALRRKRLARRTLIAAHPDHRQSAVPFRAALRQWRAA